MSSSHKTTTRRAALAALAAATVTLPVAAEATAPDPVFAAIDRHKQAYAALLAASAECDRVNADYEDEYVGPQHDREWDAKVDFAETVPTTQAGLLAMLIYADDVAAAERDPDTFDMNRRADRKPIRPILETLAIAARALSLRA